MNNKFRSDNRVGWLMAAPALTGLALFIGLPFLLALILSFTNLKLASPLPLTFVGLQHYARIIQDPVFLRALLNNLIFAVVVVPAQTGCALLLALLVNRKLPGMVVFRTLFFLPVIFPFALISVVWMLLYAPGPNGVINSVLELLTFGIWEPQDFLHNQFLALPAIMVVSIWQGAGFQMIVYLAGLQDISEELYEAARLDGANSWQQFWHVTFPCLRNTTLFVVSVTTILSFRLFDQVQIMTKGGPLNATATVVFEAVRAAFERQQIARGSAMTVVFFIIVLCLTIFQRRLVREDRRVG
ncbi:carbohydrate ABC transporter permease [Candidatus Electrothrix sp.]|uniref:carbohydrate ABC transporter permease n=1 Tax=Candidatus Electrothrix sp. TaxID=2170559 RepID=UPI0040574D66